MQIQWTKVALAAACAAALSGCASLRPVPQALNAGGPVNTDDGGKGPFTIFRISYDRAYGINKSAAEAAAPMVESATSQDAYRRMAADGIAVVNSNCADYFEHLGEEQKLLNFDMDAIPVMGGIATGILAFTNPGAAIPGAIVTLVTTASTAAVKAYQKDFLFAPENIADVRSLVEKAMTSHYNSVFEPSAKDPKITWTFSGAVTVVRDHQAICRASSMVSLVSQSIKKSTTQSDSPDSGDASTQSAASGTPAKAATLTKITTPTTPKGVSGKPMTTSTHKSTKVTDPAQ